MEKTMTTEVATIAEIARASTTPHDVTIIDPLGIAPDTKALALITPNGGMQIYTPDENMLNGLRGRPVRRAGTAVMGDVESFIKHADRFKDDHSALFVSDNPESPAITSVLNYHPKGSAKDALPRFGDHRTVYNFPLSEEWIAWKAIDDVTLNMIDFAEFLENRIMDIIAVPDFLTKESPKKLSAADGNLKNMVELFGGKLCGPDTLMGLSRELKINEKATIVQKKNLSSGAGQISFGTEHTDENGITINIPSMFLLAIPVFNRGGLYRIAVRLRYRISGGAVMWTMKLHRPDLSFDDAIEGAAKEVQEKTGLPLFYGTPE